MEGEHKSLHELELQREFWVEIRREYQLKVNVAQRNIENIHGQIMAQQAEVRTGSAWDVPPLKQNLFEMLGDRILKALRNRA